MTEPRTEAGRVLFARLWAPTLMRDILAIEAEAASPSLDRDPLRERNRARSLASEDASGGYREIAGCKCEHCAALSSEETT